jgi:hypothetical protein
MSSTKVTKISTGFTEQAVRKCLRAVFRRLCFRGGSLDWDVIEAHAPPVRAKSEAQPRAQNKAAWLLWHAMAMTKFFLLVSEGCQSHPYLASCFVLCQFDPRHVDDPDKFLKSEVDLDEEIKKCPGCREKEWRFVSYIFLYKGCTPIQPPPCFQGLLWWPPTPSSTQPC